MAKKQEETPSVNELSGMTAADESAFDEAFADEPKKPDLEKAPAVKEAPSEKVEEKQPKEDVKSEEGKPKEEAGDKGTSGADYEQQWKTLQGEFKKEREEKESLKGKIDELQTKMSEIDKLQDGTRKEQAEAEKKKAKLAEALFDLYADLTPEEKAELASYDDEFDVVSKSESKKRTLFEKKIKAYMADLVENSNKSLLTNLAPFLMASEKNTEESHFKAIKTAHQDFEKYRDDGSLKKWIDDQPGYLKKEMQRVYNEGEAEDVIDLFSRFKKDNNIGTTVKDDAATKAEQDDIEKKKKLESMEVVDSGKRAIGSGGVGKSQDYDAAFDEAIKASK